LNFIIVTVKCIDFALNCISANFKLIFERFCGL